MKSLLLTDVPSGKQVMINPDLVRLWESNADGTTHLVFDAYMGRVVQESLDVIAAAIGVDKP